MKSKSITTRTLCCHTITFIFLLLIPACLSADSSTTTQQQDHNHDNTATTLSKAERLYNKAIEIRDGHRPSEKNLKKAVEMLSSAAGLLKISIEKPSTGSDHTNNNSSSSGTSTHSSDDDDQLPSHQHHHHQHQPTFVDASWVKLKYRNNHTYEHAAALRELIFVFRSGDGAPLNPAIAHKLLQELAAGGDAEAQAELAFYLATGINPVAPNPQHQVFQLIEPDQPSALIHYYFASKSGEPTAQMALGYRHLHGIGVARSCRTAALYYVPVAERVLEMAKVRDGLPTQRSMRLSYKSVHSRPKPTADQEFLHYKWFADYGHADAARAIAQLLSHGDVRDYGEAIRYLRQAANAGDPGAMAHLGHMYANGIAVEQDNATSWKWFWKAAEQGHPSGFYGLGYMHLVGQGAEVDHKLAFNYFKQSVDVGHDWSGVQDALFYLGIMHLKGLGTPIDHSQAISYLTMSSRGGNLLAAYNLAVLHLREMAGEKGIKACKAAVSQLKRVAERGWPAIAEANEDFTNGEYEWSLLNYLKAAEWGNELGQSNAGWMLTERYGYQGPRAGQLAVAVLKRAAEQGNTAALVRIGDSYWYGKGVARDWTKAGRLYAEAARFKVAQALFNLGYMHQYGAGVSKDFPLAKRYYDRSAEASPDAWLATAIALTSLKVQQWWEKTEPRLPRQWVWLWQGLFTVKEPEPVVGGGGGGDDDDGVSSSLKRRTSSSAHSDPNRSGGRLYGGSWPSWRYTRYFSMFDVILRVLDEVDDNFDITIAMWLAGLLALVLWRRRALRARGIGGDDRRGVDGGGDGVGAREEEQRHAATVTATPLVDNNNNNEAPPAEQQQQQQQHIEERDGVHRHDDTDDVAHNNNNE